jgi:hypothetical protein
VEHLIESRVQNALVTLVQISLVSQFHATLALKSALAHRTNRQLFLNYHTSRGKRRIIAALYTCFFHFYVLFLQDVLLFEYHFFLHCHFFKRRHRGRDTNPTTKYTPTSEIMQKPVLFTGRITRKAIVHKVCRLCFDS